MPRNRHATIIPLELKGPYTETKRSLKPIPLQLRIAIVSLRYHTGMTFLEISKKLDLDERTCGRIFKQAITRAADPTDFRDVLACVEPADRPGRVPGQRNGQKRADVVKRQTTASEEPRKEDGDAESVQTPSVEPTEDPTAELSES